MAEHRHEEVRRLFDLVLDVPSDQRESVLERECAGDEVLKNRILAMIDAAEDERFLGDATAGIDDASPAPSFDPTVATTPREQSGQVIGRYKLLQPIGEGGFGTVWMAEQKEPVKRRVALKIIKLGMDTKQVIARFEAERQALAMMDHPNIAKVLDAGATETGRPYFVMELVKGVPAFSQDGELLVTACFDGYCRVFDWTKGTLLASFEHPDLVEDVDISPDGDTVLTGCGDGKARLWSVSTGREVREAVDHAGSILAAEFSPDGRLFATGSRDRTARI